MQFRLFVFALFFWCALPAHAQKPPVAGEATPCLPTAHEKAAVPDDQRAREYLEDFGLERLRITRMGRDAHGAYADVRAPGGRLCRVHRGNYAGVHFGLVDVIGKRGVVLRELLQGYDQEWVEARALLEAAPATGKDARWDALMARGQAAAINGDVKTAGTAFTQALLRAKELGAHDARVADSLWWMAEIQYATNQLEPATWNYQEALAVRRGAFAPDPAAVARVKERLRGIYVKHKAPPEWLQELDREPEK